MSLRINDEAPNFTADTTQGTIDFHQWIGDGWAVLFSHPKDFTPVCTTELGAMAGLESEFARRGAKVIGSPLILSPATKKWSQDIEDVGGHKVTYPMIGDPELKIAKLYDMLAADAGTTSEGRTPALNAPPPVRTVFVIGPDKKIKLLLAYPMTTGRNFNEVLRVLDSMQLTARHKVATPANWEQGDDCHHYRRRLQRRRRQDLPRLQDGEAVPPHNGAAPVVLYRFSVPHIMCGQQAPMAKWLTRWSAKPVFMGSNPIRCSKVQCKYKPLRWAAFVPARKSVETRATELTPHQSMISASQ